MSIARVHRRIKKALSNRSARAWVLKLGWNWKEVKRVIDKDGNKCKDVKKYRNPIFLPRLQSLQLQMIE